MKNIVNKCVFRIYKSTLCKLKIKNIYLIIYYIKKIRKMLQLSEIKVFIFNLILLVSWIIIVTLLGKNTFSSRLETVNNFSLLFFKNSVFQ